MRSHTVFCWDGRSRILNRVWGANGMSGLSVCARGVTGLFQSRAFREFKILELFILYHPYPCLSIEKFKKIELNFRQPIDFFDLT